MAYFNITNDAYAIMQIQRILRDLELLENEYSSVDEMLKDFTEDVIERTVLWEKVKSVILESCVMVE